MIKILKIISWTLLSFFVIIQFLLILCVLFGFVEEKDFEIQITVITGVMILCLNTSMIVIYCRYAGMPYKSDTHYVHLKHCGYVVAYWTFAF